LIKPRANPFSGGLDRAYDQGTLRQQRAVRLVYDESDIRRALTLAYRDPRTLSVITLAHDIILSKPLTISGPSHFSGVIITGSNQFTLSNRNAQASLIIIESPCTIQDLRLIATNVTNIIDMADDPLAVYSDIALSKKVTLNNLEFHTLGTCTRVFNFRAGYHLNKHITNAAIINSGTLSAAFGAPDSFGWSADSIRMNAVSNIIEYGAYQSLRISNLFSEDFDFASCQLYLAAYYCTFSQLSNISPINITNKWNVFSGVTYDSGTGSLTSSGGGPGPGEVGVNQFLGVSGYNTIALDKADVLMSNGGSTNTQPVVLGRGFSIGDTVTLGNQVSYSTPHIDWRVGRANTDKADTIAIDSIPTLTNTSYLIESDIVAHKMDGYYSTNTYKLLASAKNVAGVVTIGLITEFWSEDMGAASVGLDVDDTNIRVWGTGIVSTNISWGSMTKVTRL